MRLSRVPVLSLCRRDLVYDPGGHRVGSPYRRAVSAFQAGHTVRCSLPKDQASPSSAHPFRDHHFQASFEVQYKPRRLAFLGF
jgi:hypothetical protein